VSLEIVRYQTVLGALIVRLRTERGVTQDVLAKCMGVSQSMVSRLEDGKQPLDKTLLDKICVELGVTLGTLDERVHALSDLTRTAENAIGGKWIASREAVRKPEVSGPRNISLTKK
jgi:transcriptional regulator with XRE-family HTH domain